MFARKVNSECAMYREIITPESSEITLKIPVAYLNKRIEVLIFEVNEGIDQTQLMVEPPLVTKPDLDHQMELAQTIMANNADVLNKLAQ